MKKFFLIALLVPLTAVIFSSCAAVTGKLATPERIAQLPEPLRSQLKEMIRQQNAMAARFTSGTKKMLDAYGIIADAIGLKDVAAKLRAESQALKAGSSLADTRKAISRSDGLMKEVRSKMSSSNNVTAVSKEKFNQGVRTKTEAYMIEDGRIGPAVKGATLIGNGPDVLTRISAIGDDMMLDPGIGTCGKQGQGVPVGVGQPTLRIDGLTVGGTAR